MVITRSAEKRIAAAGKVEELVVRPKLNGPESSPTPIQSVPVSRKRSNITVNVPPPPGKRTRLGTNTFLEETSRNLEDDSPYTTAKESPGSFRDAEGQLSSAVEGTFSPLQPLQRVEIPSSQETFTSPGKDELAWAAATSELPRHTATQPDFSVIFTTNSSNATIHNVHQESGNRQPSLDADDQLSNQGSSSGEESDDAPEVLGTKRSTWVQRVPNQRITKRKVRPDGSPVSKSRSWLETVDYQARTPNTQLQPSQSMVLQQDTPSDITSPTQDSDTLIQVGDTSNSTVALSKVEQKPGSSGSSSATITPMRNRTEINSLTARPEDSLHLATTVSSLPTSALPKEACNTLESYRQNLLLQRRNFQLTSEWAGKRRRFVVSG